MDGRKSGGVARLGWLVVALALVVLAGSARTAAPPPLAAPGSHGFLPVLVRAEPLGSLTAERLVASLGGEVTRRLPLIDGFAARVPERALPTLMASTAVAAVSPDAQIRLRLHGGEDDDGDDDEGDDDDIPLAEYDELPPDTVWQAAIGLPELRSRFDGDDVTVAVLDTGVARHPDLEQQVEARVDFTAGLDGVDQFGHGTHMAGIVAGDGTASAGRWVGVAPESDVVALKVAGPDGATDVSVVLAALQWVVSNRDRFGIRVLNLSFGTDAGQSALLDPLNYAVERVWDAGILVVVSAGNAGPDPGTVRKPGDDPVALTVGAADLNGTVEPTDDTVAPFSSRGPTVDGVAKPDLLAPGISIVSLRAEGSTVDRLRPPARLEERYFKGTGTSQATAIVSGIAALMFEADPLLTPEEARAALLGTASGALRGTPGAGAGLVDAAAAVEAVLSGTYEGASRSVVRSSGRGALDGSRGSHHVYADPDGDGSPALISGEVDVLGLPWNGQAWSAQAWSGDTWASSPWQPLVAESAGWAPFVVPPVLWGGVLWDAQAWSSRSWTESSWVAQAWSAQAWSTWNS